MGNFGNGKVGIGNFSFSRISFTFADISWRDLFVDLLFDDDSEETVVASVIVGVGVVVAAEEVAGFGGGGVVVVVTVVVGSVALSPVHAKSVQPALLFLLKRLVRSCLM